MVLFDAYFGDDRRTEQNIAHIRATSRGLKGGVIEGVSLLSVAPRGGLFMAFQGQKSVH